MIGASRVAVNPPLSGKPRLSRREKLMTPVRLVEHPKAERDGTQKHLGAIFGENRLLLQKLKSTAVDHFVQSLRGARAVFFSAQGRAGCVLRCFCMRLMHLGYQVYFCGDTNTPAITREDLLVVLSGSGETSWTIEAVRSAKKCHARTYGILGNPDSRIGRLVDRSIHLPGTTKLCREGEPPSLQMAGSLFEQSAFLLLEAVVLGLWQEEEGEMGDLLSRHAVIE
jgi:6-phospho-3-hexuloisomerase